MRPEFDAIRSAFARLVPFWFRFGSVLGPFGIRFGPFRVRVGSVLDPCSACFANSNANANANASSDANENLIRATGGLSIDR